MSLLFLLGILSILQITLLPGMVLVLGLRAKGIVSRLNPIEQVAVAFASSLVINDVLVTGLTLIHAHTEPVWLSLIVIEILAILWRWRSWVNFWTVDLSAVSRIKQLDAGTAVGGVLLLSAALFICHLFTVDWQTVFVGNDDVASWDRWAMEWSSGHLPTFTSLYPQLIPTNWSVSYVLIGSTDIKMFAKAICPSYTLVTTLLFLSLAIRRREPSYLLGGFLYVCLLLHYMGPTFLTYGYADQPLAFFSFLCFYLCICCPADMTRNDAAAIIASATAALLVKQGGVFVFVAALFFIAWKSRKSRSHLNFLHLDWIGVLCTSLLLFCASWYGCKFYQIRGGGDKSNLTTLTQTIHQGRTYPQRVLHTWWMFYSTRSTGHVVTISLAVLIVFSLLVPRTRAITITVALPFLAFYALFFSYEIRPALAIFPVLAVVCAQTIYAAFALARRFVYPRIYSRNHFRLVTACLALGAAWLVLRYGIQSSPSRFLHTGIDPFLVETIDELMPRAFLLAVLTLAASFTTFTRVRFIPLGAILLIGTTGFLAWGAAIHSSAGMLAQQLSQARNTVGDPQVNNALYKLTSDGQIKSGIITDYWFLESLPTIHALFRRATLCTSCSVRDLDTLFAHNADAQFLLTTNSRFAPETLQYLTRSQRFSTIFFIDGERLLELNKTAPAE